MLEHEKSFYRRSLEIWGTESQSSEDIIKIRKVFGDSAQDILDYYST